MDSCVHFNETPWLGLAVGLLNSQIAESTFTPALLQGLRSHYCMSGGEMCLPQQMKAGRVLFSRYISADWIYL